MPKLGDTRSATVVETWDGKKWVEVARSKPVESVLND